MPAFREKFERIVASRILPEQMIPPVEIDGVLKLKDITPGFFNLLRQMEPFGPGNSNPVFESQNVYIVPHSARIVGNSHLKLVLTQDGHHTVDAIGFGLGEYLDRIMQGSPFSVCYTVEMNEFRGAKKLQLRLKDIRWEE
nr:hypothetical protein [Hymenobacter qilianensis]